MSYNTKIPNNLNPFTMPKKHSIQVQSLGIPTKKDNGQYVEGEYILYNYSANVTKNYDGSSMVNSLYHNRVTNLGLTDPNTMPAKCILAVPILYGQRFTSEYAGTIGYDFIRGKQNDYNAYQFLIVSEPTSYGNRLNLYSLLPEVTNTKRWHNAQNSYVYYSGTLRETSSEDFPTYSSTDPYYNDMDKNIFLGRMEQGELENYNGYVAVIKKGQTAKIREEFSKYSVLNNKLFYTTSTESFPSNFNVGSSIYATLPIFLCDAKGIEEMAKYFSGDDWDSENKDDLITSEIDLTTDWTIYVNGAQNPSISTTWKSEKLESFLSSEDNKNGLSFQNIGVEFRYPLYKHTKLGLGLSESEYSEDSFVYDGGYNYSSKKNDSYESLMFQNYPYLKERFEVDSFIYGENSEPRLETEKEFYAQLQFRLKINEKKFSSWCYFKIGVIGSPNIADFSEMSNEGGVLKTGISDGSTVTIIYDESPEGETGDKGYIDPVPPIPDIDPSDPTPITPSDGGLNLLTTSYVMTEEQIKQLASFLWGATFLQNLELINNSPIENIVGCKMMPIAISGSNNVVQIGNVDTNVNGAVVSSVPVVTVGSLSIDKLYDNFLDYAPYTQITLFLPFIGFVEIDTNVVVDNTLSVKYVFDIVTGTCKAMLYVNNIYYTSYNGSCGIDIPLVASNRAQVESQFLGSVINGAISGNVGGIIGAGIGAQYHSQSSGSYSPTCGWQETKQVYAIINRPTCQYPETYGHNIGYPCKLSRSLNSLRGFTVCDSNVDLSGIPCTEMERQEIYNALTSGVYL